MKICPNCGAENEENVQICILCEYEFEVPAETQQVSEPVYQEPVQPVYAAQTAYPVDNAKGNSKALPVALGVGFGLVAAAALFFGLNYFDSQKKAPDAPVADVVSETTVEATEATEAETTADTAAETTAEAATELQTEAVTQVQTQAATEALTTIQVTTPVLPKVALSNEELGLMYNLFFIKNYIPSYGGYLEDITGDGIDELVMHGWCYFKYENGEVNKYSLYDANADSYTYPGMKTQFYSRDDLQQLCLQKAMEYGFTINKDFEILSNTWYGYVKTVDITSSLNLRSHPNTDSEIITQLPNGLLFHIDMGYDETGKCYYALYGDLQWYHIITYYNGRSYSGYVSGDYVSVSDTSI